MAAVGHGAADVVRRLESRARTSARRHPVVQTMFLTARGALVRLGEPSARVYVLCYHDVAPHDADALAAGLRRLRSIGPFVSWDDCLRCAAGDGQEAGPAFCLTFDDGHPTWASVVLPLLQGMGLPATFFVATSLVERDEHAISWAQCRRLAEAGMTIGSHSHTHRPLIQLDADEVYEEMTASKALLESRLEVEANDFCAPFGQPGVTYDAQREVALAARAGYRSFVTTVRGAVRCGDSPYAVKRLTMSPGWPPLAVKGRLQG
jgi:peptidoglycan/xylan/chitin deacetylase (PgdA/CDA1 family)